MYCRNAAGTCEDVTSGMPVILIVPPPFVSMLAPGNRMNSAVPDYCRAASSRGRAALEG